MKRFFLLSEREKNAAKMCSQCEHNHGGKCDHPVVLDRKYGTFTKLVYMSDDGMTCQIFRKECLMCKHYHEEQTDVDKWRGFCDLEDEDSSIRMDYREYCPRFEEEEE
jgi:hypothetical protein